MAYIEPLNSQGPPKVIYYFRGGGKSGPFYTTLRGIKSAFKTSSWRWSWRHMSQAQVQDKRRVWKGVVTWTEVTEDVAPPIEELQR